MWFILDKKYKVIGVLDKELIDGCPILSGTYDEKLQGGYTTLQFSVPTNHETANLLQNEGFIIYTDNPNGNELFRMKVFDSSSGDVMTKNVKCEPAATADLMTQRIRPYNKTSQPLSTVMTYLLTNTSWELGICEYDGMQNVSITDYPTASNAIQTIIAQYNAEIEYKVEFNGTKVTKKVINIYRQRGKKTNIPIEYGLNMKGFTRNDDSNQLYTLMIGVASKTNADGTPIMIKDASLTIDSQFVKGDDYVADNDAFQEWNNNGQHLVGYFNDQNATSANELLANTLTELKKFNHITSTYTIDIALLEQLSGYEHLRINIGDTVMIKDVTYPEPIYLNARVLEKITNITDPTQGQIILGEYAQLKVQPIVAMQNIQKTIALKQQQWTDAKAKADQAQQSVSDLSTTVTDIDNRTQPAQMISTVVYSGDLATMMNSKADTQDISDMATGQMLTDVKNTTIEYIDGRIDGSGGVNESINALSSKLDKTTSDITAEFTSAGGVNLVKNSIGFAGTDLWTVNGTINTIKNQELEQVGFGSGFISNVGETGYIEQVINTATNSTYSLSFLIKKTVDNATNGYAGVEVWENGVKLSFVGKDSGQGVTNGYELGLYSFTTQHNQVTIRVTFGTNASAIITSLMVNEGSNAFKWQHANGEVYNGTIQMNENGIKVINGNTGGYTNISDTEFSGYAPVNGSMTRTFSLNGATTEVYEIKVTNEINMGSLTMASYSTASFTGWVLIPNG